MNNTDKEEEWSKIENCNTTKMKKINKQHE